VRLGRADYHTDAATLAQRLIGATLVTRIDGVRTAGVILETEAYLGPEDKAAHSVGARFTERTAPMFERAGTAYVFLTYGMHHCFNVVCDEVGMPCAVLVRAVWPEEGIDVMRERRSVRPRKRALRERDLCSGPAKLCQALAISKELTGVDLVDHPHIWVERGASAKERGWTLDNGARIGVEYAAEWASAPLRWWVKGHAGVSR
jgi:DNA-3-methyladenine glycosylase